MILRIFVRAPLLLIGSLIMAIITSPQLAFLPLALMPVELVAVIWIVNKATPLYSIVQEKLDVLNEVMQENLAGVRVVKAFVRAEHEEARFGQANKNLSNQSINAARVVAIMPAFMMFTLNLGVVGVLWFGGAQFKAGNMQLGQIIAFVNYLTMTLFSLMMVSQLIIQLARAEASAKRIQEVLDTQPLVQDQPESIKDFHPKGRVSFENVSFCYEGTNGNPVLKDVSFSAEPGQVVALLGTTGAGKSSLVHLIPRFYDVTSGRVSIDGQDVRDVEMSVLRSQIGVALQETVLFSGSIRDNIRYGRPTANDADVIEAARLANADGFIHRLPHSYQTVLTERGSNLSQGQRQLLAIARAILADPDILILDEATSNVDTRTEKHLQEALMRLMKGRTSFVIAHRLSTIRDADQVLVINNGEIIERGNHDSLLMQKGFYYRLYMSQFKVQGQQ